MISNAAVAQAKIEQMIVTAQKREQDIQAVAASISAFGGEQLQERQVKTFQDLMASTPNLQWSQASSATPVVAIRGVSPDGTDASMDPTVAVHIDGVYQPRIYSMFMSMMDIDSVEVLRGPQGTLYGRNANAGVVNFNTKRPTDTFEASGTIFGGSYSRYGARGYVSGPILDDKVALRIAGMVDRHNGWGKSYTTGQKTEAEYDSAARASLRLKPTDDVTIDVIGSRALTHGSPDVYLMAAPNTPGPNFDPSAANHYATIAASGLGTYTLEPRRNYTNLQAESHSKTDSGTAIITWDIAPDISFKSVSGIQHAFYTNFQDPDEMAYNYLGETSNQDSKTFTQEFNLSAKLWDRLDTVVGLYYLKDHNNSGIIFPFYESGAPYFSFPAPNPVIQNNPADDIVFNISSDQRTTSKAAFFDTTLSITDQLRLLGGIRRTLDHKGTRLTAILSPLAVGCNHAQAPDLDYHSTTGKMGLQYDFTPNIMGYVQWQNGFKTGGYNINDFSCQNSFAPEKITSWEAGVKSRLFDDTTTLNISVFHYNYTNLQVTRALQTTTLIDNAAKAKIYGAEIELNSYLTDDVKADLGVGLLHSEYKNYSAAEYVGGPIYDLTGKQLIKAPKATVNLGLEYTARVGDLGELKSRGEATYTAKQYFNAFNEDISKQDAYMLFNAIFTFTPDNSPYQFQAYCRNIADKAYRTGVLTVSILNYSRGYWGPPRTFGMEATAKF